MLFKLFTACLGFIIFKFYKNYWVIVLKRLFETRYKGKIFKLHGYYRKNNFVYEDWSQPILSMLFLILFIITGFLYSERSVNNILSALLLILLKWLMLFSFASVAWFDAATGLIPDILNISVLVIGFLHKGIDNFILSKNYDVFNIYAIGILIFIFSYLISILLSKFKLRLIGGGDIKFLAALVWMGFDVCLYVLITSLIFAIIKIIFTNCNKSFIKFGPYLSFSASLFLITKL